MQLEEKLFRKHQETIVECRVFLIFSLKTPYITSDLPQIILCLLPLMTTGMSKDEADPKFWRARPARFGFAVVLNTLFLFNILQAYLGWWSPIPMTLTYLAWLEAFWNHQPVLEVSAGHPPRVRIWRCLIWPRGARGTAQVGRCCAGRPMLRQYLGKNGLGALRRSAHRVSIGWWWPGVGIDGFYESVMADVSNTVMTINHHPSLNCMEFFFVADNGTTRW